MELAVCFVKAELCEGATEDTNWKLEVAAGRAIEGAGIWREGSARGGGGGVEIIEGAAAVEDGWRFVVLRSTDSWRTCGS